MPPKDIQSAGLEDEARVLLKDIQGKIQSGDAREAKKLMDRMAEKHAGTQFFKEKVVQDLKNELEVVGNRVTNEDLRPHIDKWYVINISIGSGLTLLVFGNAGVPIANVIAQTQSDT